MKGDNKKCVLCNNDAHWKYHKKNCPDGLKYLCDKCLMKLPNPNKRLDDYDYIHKGK